MKQLNHLTTPVYSLVKIRKRFLSELLETNEFFGYAHYFLDMDELAARGEYVFSEKNFNDCIAVFDSLVSQGYFMDGKSLVIDFLDAMHSFGWKVWCYVE